MCVSRVSAHSLCVSIRALTLTRTVHAMNVGPERVRTCAKVCGQHPQILRIELSLAPRRGLEGWRPQLRSRECLLTPVLHWAFARSPAHRRDALLLAPQPTDITRVLRDSVQSLTRMYTFAFVSGHVEPGRGHGPLDGWQVHL